jgi:CRP/FNR family transcriptional regulator, cyclic AMP receptor protein
MTLSEAAGYFASVLVVMAFCMKDIVSLRIVAIVSNIAFLAYGIGLNLPPVWMLHAVLLPLNGWRLWEALTRPMKASVIRCDAELKNLRGFWPSRF